MSLLYHFPGFYEFSMKLIYGHGFKERYTAISALIPDGAEVLDVCAGDCFLYRNFLMHRGVRYQAIDSSKKFESDAKKHGIRFQYTEITKTTEFPPSDYVVLMGSLYQFIPHEREILRELLRAARKMLIVSEPVRNLSSSHNILLKAAGKIITYPHTERLTEAGMKKIFEEFSFTSQSKIAGGREILGLYHKS